MNRYITTIEKQHKKQQDILTLAHHDYEKKLDVYAFFKVHDKTISKDLVQDTFIRTWEYLVKGGKIELMRAFLYHVLNNLIVDEYRKRKNLSLDDLIEKGFEPNSGDPSRLFDILDGKAVIRLIKKLPASYQEVMELRYVHELSLEEISRLTGRTKNALAVHFHRGLKKLKVLYEQGPSPGSMGGSDQSSRRRFKKINK